MEDNNKFKAFMSKLKIDTSNKKVNLIVSAVCLVIAIVITIISGIQFSSFRNYEAEFVLRDGVVDEVIKFHEYSKHLEGTIADSDIYVINGTENTVALVKADKASGYSSTIPATATICAVKGNDTQISAAQDTLGRKDFVMVDSVKAAKEGVLNGTYDVAILRHADAKVAAEGLAIAKAKVEKLPSILVLGGTHPNEPAGQLAATLYLENAKVERGILYVVTELNRSGYSHSLPQEATPWYYSFKVGDTTRTFKYGARTSNTVDQWPTPDVYRHSSGQKLSGSEVRNINRAYPGSETGTFTERIGWAMTNFVLQNEVTMVIDLHEASPEYAVINAMVYHQDSKEIASTAFNNYFENIYDNIDLQLSALDLHGLTHRELGDYTGAYVFLFETSNASQGKLHGKVNTSLIMYDNYVDKFYEYATSKTTIDDKIIYGAPVAMRERVGRHVESVDSIVRAFNQKGGYSRSLFEYTKMKNPPKGGEHLGDLLISSVPTYSEIMNNGVAYYLLPSERK